MKRYQLASDFWDGPSLVIREPNGREDRIATFPIRFLRTCGDNTWSYICRVIVELISVEDVSQLDILDDKGTSVDRSMEPAEGVYFLSKSFWVLLHRKLIPDTDSQVVFTSGPEYYSAIKAPNPEGSYSTRSDSKRSSVNQVKVNATMQRKPQMLTTVEIPELATRP